ncbi:cupin domain-containing protein [Microvirga roseola]|uniref:cupin domain-containing protein n=1 Tax=Microvirga roseola TaxID=2883126 RepID=UPI001E46766A|nr:cupin domain-containing protein [Microvirga roseola]
MAQARGYGAPNAYNAPLGTETYVFKSNGIVPNSSLPLIVRRGAIPPSAGDPSKAFKTTFAKNGWTNAWLGTIHDYHHYHPNTHEVLGIASGSGSVRFGGEDGELVAVGVGDVVVIPAGVAHALINGTDDFAVVGAYPDGRDYETVRDDPGALASSQKRIADVPLPDMDPVDGADGPLVKLWS